MELKDIKTIITSGSFILAVVLYLIFNNSVEKTKVETKTDSENFITPEYAENVTGNQLIGAEYVNTIDGDTFRIKLAGKEERVRLLMIDTPEMNYEENAPMPFAEEAKDFTMHLLQSAEKIEVLFDVGSETDHYGRLLSYVFVDDILLQERLLQEGYAVVRYAHEPNNTLETEFRKIENHAKTNKIKIWSHDDYLQKDGFHPEVVTGK